jgi:hypothetical protein
MGILSKLAFWRKNEDDFSDLSLGPDMGMSQELGLPPEPVQGNEFGMNDLSQQQSAIQQQQQFNTQPQARQQQYRQQPNMPLPSQQPRNFDDNYDEPMQRRSPMEFGTPMSPLRPAPSHPAFSPPQESHSQNRDLELVSAKLDAIKAYLDTISQRLTNLERIARGEHENKRWY